MLDFRLDDELRAIGNSLLRFIETEVSPIERDHAATIASERNIYDEAGRYTPELQKLRRQVRMKSAEAGFYTMFGSQELGGAGLGPVAAVYLNELMAAHCGPGRELVHPVVIPSPFTNGLSPLLLHLDPAVRAGYLPAIASGEKTMCFGLSEPEAGSDVLAIKSRAVRDGDDWVLNGTKQWITNGPYADYAIVFAVTDAERAAARKGGITGFFIDTRWPGFDAPSTIPIMGHLGADIGVLTFDDLRVPDSHRLGAVDEGLKVAMGGVNVGRLGLAATVVGYARWALDRALDHARVRRTFGKPIGEHQAVQIHLADCAVEIYGARQMLLNCAWKLEQGERALAEISMVKLYCTEIANRVFDRCIQIHGGMGLTNEMRLEAGYRFTRSMRIPDGTSEIQRRTIAREMLANGAPF